MREPVHRLFMAVAFWGLSLGILTGCQNIEIPWPTPQIPVTPTATPQPASLTVWLPPEWSEETPGGRLLRERLQGFAQERELTLHVRVHREADMVALLQDLPLAAPRALPTVMLVPQPTLERLLEEEALAPLPETDEWRSLLTETPWYPYAQATVWAGEHPYALPWVGDTWVFWVDQELASHWPQQTWYAWAQPPETWAYPGGLEEPWPLWALYRAANGSFPPAPERKTDREALLEVFTLLYRSARNGVLSPDVLAWQSLEDLRRYAYRSPAWLARYSRGYGLENRVAVRISSPQGQPGLGLAWAYGWVLYRDLDPKTHERALDLLHTLHDPNLARNLVEEAGWLPVYPLEPWPRTMPWPEEELFSLDPLPASQAIQPWHAPLKAQEKALLESRRSPSEALDAFFAQSKE